MNSSDVLVRARMAAQTGWTTGEYFGSDEGSGCLVGLILQAHGTHRGHDITDAMAAPPVERALGYCYNLLGGSHSTLEEWNDEPGRTAEEVIALLAEAEAMAKDTEMVSA